MTTRLEEWSLSPEGSFGRRMADLLLRGVELGAWTREQVEGAADELSDHMLRPVEGFVDEIREDLAGNGGSAP